MQSAGPLCDQRIVWSADVPQKTPVAASDTYEFFNQTKQFFDRVYKTLYHGMKK